MRKISLSVPDIKAALDIQEDTVSEGYIYNLLKKEGFARLPRRKNSARENASSSITIEAPESFMLDFTPESFSGQNSLGMLCLLPYIQKYGIDKSIQNSDYPETGTITVEGI